MKKYVLLTVAIALLGFVCITADGQEPKKIAFVVGVSKYHKEGLGDLAFAHKDATDLARKLDELGFSVTKLVGDESTKENIERAFLAFLVQAKRLGKTDVVLVSFSGHGIQTEVMVTEGVESNKVETPFFCPFDALKGDPSSMISLNWVLAELAAQSGSGNNLLLVDACRNNPVKGIKTLDGSTVKELPSKISILFSSSPGQRSFESHKVQQGVFTHVLLAGLNGAAKNSRGEVDWLRLAAHVVSEVPLVAPDLLDDPTLEQRPNLIGNSVGSGRQQSHKHLQ